MEPALALLELDSIAVGIRTGDAMVKRSPVDVLLAGTIHPGRYLVMVGGDVAAVEEALVAGREAAAPSLHDELFLPDAHPDLTAALRGRKRAPRGEALGIVETRTVASIVGAADRGLKGAEVALLEIRLADDLGGKGYAIFQGPVAEAEAAVDLACEGLSPDLLVARVVVPQIHEEMLGNLEAASELRHRLGAA